MLHVLIGNVDWRSVCEKVVMCWHGNVPILLLPSSRQCIKQKRQSLNRAEPPSFVYSLFITNTKADYVTVALTIFGCLPVLFPLAGCGHRSGAFFC